MSTVDELREFHKLGGQNLSTALAHRVYLDIQTTKEYSDLNKAYSSDLGFIYLTATRGGRIHLFIPLLISQDCNLYKLENMQSKLREAHQQSVIHMAICDTASNVLYYTATRGFIDEPQNWHKKA